MKPMECCQGRVERKIHSFKMHSSGAKEEKGTAARDEGEAVLLSALPENLPKEQNIAWY